MNLADPELELIDPTPNIHNLFVHFDELFFWTKLMGRALVRWSKRMYSCAGICSYEGRGGLCDIALSEPLLKLRPRKDLIETLLHEMIHAFLFITNRDNDRDGHGPNFKAHMHRINRAAGLNISIYHDFHDEVKLYLKHWWRCNGICQKMKPFFGIVRRSSNRAPGPKDFWWAQHNKTCGGTFIKIKEPEKPQKNTKKPEKSKQNGNITKYINNNNNTISNKNVKNTNKENKDINVSITMPSHTKVPDIKNNVDVGRKRTNSSSVSETVRNVWANKQLPSLSGTTNTTIKVTNKPNLVRSNSVQIVSPPAKIKKIDDYFKNNASSILKNVYGEEFMITQSNNNGKLKAVTSNQSAKVPIVNIFVNCPNCNAKVYSNDINEHLDECLNRDIIKKLSKDSIQQIPSPIRVNINNRRNTGDFGDVKLKIDIKIEGDDKNKLENIVGSLQTIPPFRSKTETIEKMKKEESDQTCLGCGQKINGPIENHIEQCLKFFDDNTTIPDEGISEMDTVIICDDIEIKSEPGSSKTLDQKCPCCGEKTDKPIELHLDECLSFFNNNETSPAEGTSGIETIVIDDDEDDIFDESQTFNATGTKSPCPCCLKMIEIAEMNNHLDVCLSTS